MKIVTGRFAVSTSVLAAALMIGVAGAAHAQQSGNPAGGMIGAQSGGANHTGTAAGTGAGLGSGLSPTPGVGLSAGAAGSIGSGPTLSNMRANGTSLDMSPDPRAPNVTGRAAPPR
jgi:hypothetical protein